MDATKLKPLSYGRAMQVIRDACAASNVEVSGAAVVEEGALPRTPNDLQVVTVLHRLSDQGLVCVPTWRLDGLVVYPPTGSHLLTWYLGRHTHERSKIVQFCEQIMQFVVTRGAFNLVWKSSQQE